MFLSATPEVQVETAGNDVSYVFPPRPLQLFRWFGLVFVGFSVLFVWSPVGDLIATLRKLLAHSDRDSFEFVSLFGQLLFVLGGCVPGVLGLLLTFGRCRVDWRDGRLSVVDYAGPIRWRRRFPQNPVRKFTVTCGAVVNNRPVATGPLANLGALAAEFESSGRRMIILGYPREWLHDLARDLSTRVGSSVSVGATPPVEIVDDRKNPPHLADAPKPADTLIRIQPNSNGLSIEIPPRGLRKGSKGLFSFGVLWCLMMCGFTAMPLFKGVTIHGDFWIFIPWFWFIGLGLIVGSVHFSRRRATLVVERGGLTVTQTGLFGTKRREWRRGEIAAVCADASGMEVNNRPVIELQIHPLTGKKAGMLAGWSDDELRWLATELRRALQVPAQRG